jgi:hypothetical protein
MEGGVTLIHSVLTLMIGVKTGQVVKAKNLTLWISVALKFQLPFPFCVWASARILSFTLLVVSEC